MLSRCRKNTAVDASQYALGSHGELIAVQTVDPDNRHARGPYSCLGCGHVMVPALGSIRARHFKHKAGRPDMCLHETYLHQLAKRTLFDAISEALREGRSYPIIRLHPITCDTYGARFGITCTERTKALASNLLERFDQIEMEKGIDGHIADLLLSSSANDERLLLEIAVTHRCEAAKVDSGLAIVEIEIHTEDDIEALRSGLDATSSRVHSHNLPAAQPVVSDCQSPCMATCLLVLLYDSGKVWYAEPPLSEIDEHVSDHRLNSYAVFDARITHKERPWPFVAERMREFAIHQKYIKHQQLRSCLICSKNGGRRNRSEVFCHAAERDVWMSTSATRCGSYSPPFDAEEADRLFAANAR